VTAAPKDSVAQQHAVLEKYGGTPCANQRTVKLEKASPCIVTAFVQLAYTTAPDALRHGRVA